MTRIFRLLGCIFLPFMIACEPPEDMRPDRPPPPESGIQFEMPEAIIPAYSEIQLCWVPDWQRDADLFIKSFDPYQGPAGHHLVALSSMIPRAPGDTWDCTSIEDMVALNPLVFPNLSDREILPDGYGVRLGRYDTVVMQSHFVNATDHDILVSDIANVITVPDQEVDSDMIESSYIVVNRNDLNLAPGIDDTYVDAALDIPHPINLLFFFGHMHDYGAKLHISVKRAINDFMTEEIYGIDQWSGEMRDAPPFEFYDEGYSIVMEPGDRVHIECVFNNETGETLHFPQEMCTGIGGYWPALDEGTIILKEEE